MSLDFLDWAVEQSVTLHVPSKFKIKVLELNVTFYRTPLLLLRNLTEIILLKGSLAGGAIFVQ